MPDITLTLTVPQVQRVAVALGKYWNLMDAQAPPQPRDATLAEVKAYLIRQLRGLVIQQERRVAEGALPVPPDLVIV